VYEDFREDICKALVELKESLSKYSAMKIIFPGNTYFPEDIIKGYMDFCQDYAFKSCVVSNMQNEFVAEGEVYIAVMEEDLIILLEKILQSKLMIGKDIGVISYNETPLKKILMNGITTISTDFQKMGQFAAELILENRREHIAVPFKVRLRNSL
jgi:hypothetical protein